MKQLVTIKQWVTIYAVENGQQELSETQWIMFKSAFTFHRIGGPAIEYHDTSSLSDSSLREIWWIEGLCYTKTHYSRIMKKIKNMTLAERLTDPTWWVREMT